MQQICSYPSFQMLYYFFFLESNNRVILPSSLTEIYITRKIFANTDTGVVYAFIQIDLLVVAGSLCAVPILVVSRWIFAQ